MTRTVTREEVRLVLEKPLGRDLVCSDGFAETLSRALSTWDFDAGDLPDFYRRMEDLLVQSCFIVLGSTMRYKAHTGQIYTISLSDFPDLADRCLSLLLPRFPSFPDALPVLQDLAFRKGSYAAMLALYRNYSSALGSNISFIASMMKNRVVSDGLPGELDPDYRPGPRPKTDSERKPQK